MSEKLFSTLGLSVHRSYDLGESLASQRHGEQAELCTSTAEKPPCAVVQGGAIALASCDRFRED